MKFRHVAASLVLVSAAAGAAFVAWSGHEEIDADSVGPWAKPIAGDYWAHRVSYPTMNFSPAWYEAAKSTDKLIAS
ncbi:MAG: hypothetical protein WAS23_12930, partial [Dokdonella sp.]|uniref:hypothetical protein n=1 Tax=Dokdonella sp. TaxID=2291710 RepID=UPI003BAED5C7